MCSLKGFTVVCVHVCSQMLCASMLIAVLQAAEGEWVYIYGDSYLLFSLPAEGSLAPIGWTAHCVCRRLLLFLVTGTLLACTCAVGHTIDGLMTRACTVLSAGSAMV